MHISVNVDECEVLCEVSDKALLREIEDRKLKPVSKCETAADPLELVHEALVELRCGRAGEAMLILERILNPKWKDTGQAQEAYAAARKRA